MDAQLTRTKVSFSFCEVYFRAKISYANRAQRDLIPRRFADRFAFLNVTLDAADGISVIDAKMALIHEVKGHWTTGLGDGTYKDNFRKVEFECLP